MPINYSEYGKEFQAKSGVLRKAYGKCAICGADNYQPNPETGSKVVLTVHHLDGDKHNNELLNLVPLCQKCHLAEHKEEREGGKISEEFYQWRDELLEFVGYVVAEGVV